MLYIKQLRRQEKFLRKNKDLPKIATFFTESRTNKLILNGIFMGEK
jgi:hypothetical protein